MSQIIYEQPVKEIRGAISKGGIISRRKHYRDTKGNIIREGKIESYAIKQPRDFTRTPAQGDELKNQNLFRQACLQAFEELQNPAKRAQWEARFKEQLTRTTPDTPIDPKTGTRKRYYRFDAFVRATIHRQLKLQQQ